jgi:hypothetical protein
MPVSQTSLARVHDADPDHELAQGLNENAMIFQTLKASQMRRLGKSEEEIQVKYSKIKARDFGQIDQSNPSAIHEVLMENL